MIHEMNLKTQFFDRIKRNLKKIEMRLFDDKRKLLKVGDNIIFINIQNKDKIKTKVVALHRFDSFKSLYKKFKKADLGYKLDEEASYKDMDQYYSKELIEKYGVVGIEIELVDFS